MPLRRDQRLQLTRLAGAAGEVAAAVACATAAVALLESAVPIAGLSVIYLLAVLLAAVRRGEIAALAAAVLSVLALNYFFIEPRHRLTIADSHNVAVLVVFLIAAVVVGRLASAARERTKEAEARARVATAREREAALLAETASALLLDKSVEAQLEAMGPRAGEALGAESARLDLGSAPAPRPGERSTRLPMREHPGWLYTRGAAEEDVRRLAEPLARLIDVALERDQMAAQAAAAEAARHADLVKTAVLHSISHDLRSPLTAITTAAGALREGELSTDDRRDLISVLESESARLARLVDDVLDLSRIQAGAVNPRLDWCDLSDIVAGSAQHVRSRHGERPIDFELPPEMPLVHADPAQLERVFSNLIENAVKFSPPGAPVRVRGAVGGGRVAIRVIDRGRGIPSGQRSDVFEPFYRGREGAVGSGLGLAICRGFVEANGGRIFLQSRAGQGTAFAVSFPLVEQPAAAP